jgi:hypothetical protein
MSDATELETPTIPVAPPTDTVTDTHSDTEGDRAGALFANRKPHNPLEDVTPERPATHPIAYIALVLAVVAVVLSAVALRSDDDGFRRVNVGNTECVIGPQGDVDVLYCRASALPPP